ncbi:ribonuclease P protein component [Algoriphagus sp. AK58]|uniref:ribonuclease P protein component n=1 Tax=Algoriphagus sp. AK58 TaxID=1406877 RepID=UPI00164F5DFD|nr:ribonuclease P protein component [Algoriphagus sp. AK58]MBC6368950.1 ribonuclease P protein component [Algoriphagus sp. AK58]
MNYKLPKSERLHAEKLIKELFNEGSSFFLYPFKVLFLVKKEMDGQTNQVLFSVSKKKIKKASGRNFIKRRIREAYRLNKSILPPNGILLGFIFVGNPEMSFSEIEPKMKVALEKLIKELPQNHSEHDSKN